MARIVIMNKNPRNAGRKQKYAAGTVIKSFRLPADKVKEASEEIYETLKKFSNKSNQRK